MRIGGFFEGLQPILQKSPTKQMSIQDKSIAASIVQFLEHSISSNKVSADSAEGSQSILSNPLRTSSCYPMHIRSIRS
jgi:hypothetical protein